MLITEYYRNLPHWQHVGACFFVTFNLRGAIPQEVYERLQEEKQLALDRIGKGGDAVQLYAEHKRHFARVDHILDTCQHGPDHLKHAEIADDADELRRVVDYVLQNLVKAGLVENWVDWPHSYLK